MIYQSSNNWFSIYRASAPKAITPSMPAIAVALAADPCDAAPGVLDAPAPVGDVAWKDAPVWTSPVVPAVRAVSNFASTSCRTPSSRRKAGAELKRTRRSACGWRTCCICRGSGSEWRRKGSRSVGLLGRFGRRLHSMILSA